MPRTAARQARAADPLFFAQALLDLGGSDFLFDCLDEAVRYAADESDAGAAQFSSCLHFLSTNLRQIRLEAEQGIRSAAAAIAQFDRRLVDMAGDEEVPVEALQAVATTMHEAGLVPSEKLRGAMVERFAAAPPDCPMNAEAMIASVVDNAGSDPFLIVESLVEATIAMPQEFRAALALALIASGVRPAVEAAALMVLDEDPKLRRALLGALGEKPERATRVTLRRLAAIRYWLPVGEQPRLDEAISSLRAAGLVPEPTLPRRAVRALASTIDGAGAQSLFVMVSEGKRCRLVSILLKEGFGVRDAWTMPSMSRREAAQQLEQIRAALPLRDVSMSYIDSSISHALGLGQAVGGLPPLGLLAAAETLGGEVWQPAPLDWRAALDRLAASLPVEFRGGAAVEATLAGSAHLGEAVGFADSWFEDDEATRRIARRKRKESVATRVARVLEEIIEPRKLKWAERFVWTASLLKEGKPAAEWARFAVVARALASGRSAATVPLMQRIAETTVHGAG